MKRFLAALLLPLLFLPRTWAVDLTITAANVILVSGTTDIGTAGAAITAGQTVYRDPTDNKIKLADANLSDNAAALVGVSLNAALVGQPVTFLKDGDLAFGSILTVGQTYVVSATGGGIAPIADLVTGWRLSYCGYATSATTMRLMVKPTGVVAP